MELEATQLSPQGQWWGGTGSSSQYGGRPRPLFLSREIANLALFHLIHLDEDIWGRGYALTYELDPELNELLQLHVSNVLDTSEYPNEKNCNTKLGRY